MQVIQATRAHIKAAQAALAAALESDEADTLADAMATAGDSVARAIVTMDGTFKGFRRNVETAANRLAARA